MKPGVKEKDKKIFALAVALVLLICLLTGCKADISEYADTQILVSGLTEEDFYITPAELADMECVELSATGSGSAGTTKSTKGYGPTLQTFLENYGYTIDEVYSVRFIGSDDYAVTYTANTWDEYEVVLSIANGSKALYESEQPLKIVTSGGNSGKWVKLVTTILVTLEEDQ